MAAYVVAVLHRTSLGVAGLDAQHRFGIGAGALASFAVLQLLVYAALQVPLGARTGGTADYHLDDFKVALSVQYLIGLFGLGGILRSRRLARQRMAAEGVVVRPIREVLAERRGLALGRPVKAEGSGQLSTGKSRRT
ncbi:MAG TPA: hypothetical protein VFH03_00310 [Actinoplanes sp.]|nr:hypothetical protein [Actinoplanes sp.]